MSGMLSALVVWRSPCSMRVWRSKVEWEGSLSCPVGEPGRGGKLSSLAMR